MEKIKEKPTLGERVKEKAVSAPKELLRKGLDDGSERLRTQLRDTAQQGRRDEYGGGVLNGGAAIFIPPPAACTAPKRNC